MNKYNKQIGAVSLFVVIFATLLITVVTVSFIRIMVQNQQQASNIDLSQSAFDSAQAGVEDAKRALLKYQTICNNFGPNSHECTDAKVAIDNPAIGCNDAVRTLSDVGDISTPGSEVKVKINGSDNELDQAYTCVKIITETDDYVGSLDQDASKFIPLIGISDFDRVKIEWFTAQDKTDSSPLSIPTFTGNSETPLLSQDNWTVTEKNRPSILRAQLIQFNANNFNIGDFEDNGNINGSNNTIFLYPTNISDTPKSFSFNDRKTIGTGGPVQANCDSDATITYACSATIILPQKITSNNYMQYLKLNPIYKSSHYRITLLDTSSALVKFKNVQPLIDSTGRANNLFRRVKTRVELTNVNFPYPFAEIEITGNLCKDFSITNDPIEYSGNVSGSSESCTP